MSASEAPFLPSLGMSSGVVSAGPTGVFHLGHSDGAIHPSFPLVALAPLPGAQSNPAVAGSPPSSPVVHGAGAPAMSGAGCGSSSPVVDGAGAPAMSGADCGSSAPVLRKRVSEMTDEEKFAEAICTRNHLNVMTHGMGRFDRPSSFNSAALLSFFGASEEAKAVEELSYHHMIPLPEVVDLWSSIREAYVDSFRSEKKMALHDSLRLALIALIQLSSVCYKGRDLVDIMCDNGEVSEERRASVTYRLRENRFSDALALDYLADLDSDRLTGKKSPDGLKILFSYLMWMDFNLIRGPSPRLRSKDPGSDFDGFSNSIRELRRSGRLSTSGQSEAISIEKRIHLVGELYGAYRTYKEMVASQSAKKFSKKSSAGLSLGKALQDFCVSILNLKEWAKTSQGLSLQIMRSPVDYTLHGGGGKALMMAHHFSLTFTSYLEHSLWKQDPKDGKWAKLNDADESGGGSPYSSRMPSPRP